ncbi:beta-lactamase class A [Georgenia satyanarayanai]|uniref:Beta-lactamase class A n=1 Tax=Georgenia satyanarayanai TaxID=860221 RepID=A0A2Y8ZXA4_9MICO|nr:beta-lactamase class A [Georgenia satyanarayanai]SSA36694.1 beta-lactamase class A [Georgenia satyanarayanai]
MRTGSRRATRGLVATSVGAALVLAGAATASAEPLQTWDGLESRLDAVVADAAESGVTLSVAVTDLAGGFDGATLIAGEDERVKAASIIKLPLLATLMADVDAGELDLDQTVTIPAGDPNIVGGSGTLKDGQFPLDITVAELMELMVQVSDNTATNVLIDLAGGFDAVNDYVEALGFEDLYLGRKMIHPASPPLQENYISAEEVTELVTLLWEGEILSAESSEHIIDLMRGQLVDTKFGAVIPRAHLANKTGELADVSHDSGIVLLPGRELAFTTTTSFTDLPRAEADVFVQETARVVYDFARLTGDVTADVEAIVQPYIDRAAAQDVRVSVGFSDLTADGDRVLLGSQEPYNPASVIKLSLLAAVMRQTERDLLHLDAPVTISPYMVVGGSGSFQDEEMPFTTTVRELVRRMVVESDNTATNVLLYHIGLPTTQELIDDLGLDVMRFNRQMFPGELIDEPANVLDVGDTLALLEAMYGDELLGEESREQILTWMSDQEVDTKFGAVLNDAPVAHKTGETGNVTHDVGYFLVPGHEAAVVVLTEVTNSGGFDETQEIGNPIVQEIGLAVYDYLDALATMDGEQPTDAPTDTPPTQQPTTAPDDGEVPGGGTGEGPTAGGGTLPTTGVSTAVLAGALATLLAGIAVTAVARRKGAIAE